MEAVFCEVCGAFRWRGPLRFVVERWLVMCGRCECEWVMAEDACVRGLLVCE